MDKEAIVAAWKEMSPADRDVWVQRTVFPEFGSQRFHMDVCPTCGYDGMWEAMGWDFGPAAEVYTQHMAAAWLVVHRMQEKGFHVAIWSPGEATNGEIYYKFDSWRVAMQKGAMEAAPIVTAEGEASAETAAEAICLAAVLALNGGESNVAS